MTDLSCMYYRSPQTLEIVCIYSFDWYYGGKKPMTVRRLLFDLPMRGLSESWPWREIGFTNSWIIELELEVVVTDLESNHPGISLSNTLTVSSSTARASFLSDRTFEGLPADGRWYSSGTVQFPPSIILAPAVLVKYFLVRRKTRVKQIEKSCCMLYSKWTRNT